MRAFGVPLLLAAVLAVGLAAPLLKSGEDAEEVARETLEFPPEFYELARSSSLNPEDFEKELHELAWTMCDFHRRVMAEMVDYESLNKGDRHPKAPIYESWLKSNPMEPTYHETCLALFQLYPNMRREIQEKEDPVLPQDDA